jgi:hypothetical protein
MSSDLRGGSEGALVAAIRSKGRCGFVARVSTAGKSARFGMVRVHSKRPSPPGVRNEVSVFAHEVRTASALQITLTYRSASDVHRRVRVKQWHSSAFWRIPGRSKWAWGSGTRASRAAWGSAPQGATRLVEGKKQWHWVGHPHVPCWHEQSNFRKCITNAALSENDRLCY